MFVYIVTVIIIFSYGFALYFLKNRGTLSAPDFINNITIFVGWIVALSIAWIHLLKTRKDNQLSKKDEIRKMLEINAFREINGAVREFSNVFSSLSIPYSTMPIRLKLHIENAQIFRFNKAEANSEFGKQTVELYRSTANFLRMIESHEIIVIEFDHYMKYIQHRVDDIHKLIRVFLDYFSKISMPILISSEGYKEFKRRCDEMYEQLMNIQTYLLDYRIELMNLMLGEIFDKKVPERKPRDPKYKTLKELAIKEKVEKESEERELKAMRGEA